MLNNLISKKNIIFLLTILTIVVISLLFLGKNNNKYANLYYSKYDRYIDSLINRDFDIHNNNFIPLEDSSFLLILYYKYDCSSCVMKCYRMMNKLSNFSIKKYVFTDSDYYNDFMLYGFKNNGSYFFHNDDHKNIRKKLKNVPTPLILYVKNNVVKSIIFPSNFLTDNIRYNFLNNLN